jgi:predicted AlkP superfamily pyrophosphatase or phosphodiesterase
MKFKKILFSTRNIIFFLACTLLAGSGVFFFATKSKHTPQRPQLTFVFVIDQFAYHYLHKVRPFLTGGLKTLLDNGIAYSHATHPHAVPSTACGHAAISSGTYAKNHGIVGNEWIDDEGKPIKAAYDTPQNAAQFLPNGKTRTDRGASSKQLMVDNLSDTFVLSNKNPSEKRMVFSFSFKARSAIMMGGKMAKTFWFDEENLGLVSSKAYMDELPAWVIKYNSEHAPKNGQKYSWKPVFEPTSDAYKFSQVDNYEHTAIPRLCTTDFSIKNAKAGSDESPEFLLEKTPHADTFMVGAVKECLTQNFHAKTNESCLLWLSFSCLDLAGHYFGPHSMEALDMVYQIDQRIQELLDFAKEKYPDITPLIALTADHGVMPIPEVLQDEGFKLPVRADAKEMVKNLNKIAEAEFGLKNLIALVKPPQFFFDRKAFKTLSSEKKHALTERLAEELRKHPSIKQVWTHYDLQKPVNASDSFAELFHSQFYKKRSPQLSVLPAPYHMITKHPRGTSHDTPYLYDLHVPLIIWRKNILERKEINDPVRVLQLPVTLAHLLDVQTPSTDEKELLPGF